MFAHKLPRRCLINCADLVRHSHLKSSALLIETWPVSLQSKLNHRATESEQEIFKLCDQIVREVSEGVVDNIGMYCFTAALQLSSKITLYTGMPIQRAFIMLLKRYVVPMFLRGVIKYPTYPASLNPACQGGHVEWVRRDMSR